MSTKTKVKPKTKTRARKAEKVDSAKLVGQLASLPYEERNHIVGHLTEANMKDTQVRSDGGEATGQHYKTFKPLGE